MTMMNIALLGNDVHTLALAKAAAAGGGRLVWAHELGERSQAIRTLAPNVLFDDHWESLLDEDLADVVIVARGDDETRAEQLRKLAQIDTVLLISHPVHSSMLLHFELDMIRRETRAVLIPYIPSRWHPAVEHLRQRLASGELGPLEQLLFERSLADRSRVNVQAQFAADVDMIRQFAGELTRLGAMDSATMEFNAMGSAARETNDGGVQADYGNLGIQLFGPSGVLARWSTEPAEEPCGGRLILLCSKGKATLTMPDDSAQWQVAFSQDPSEPQAFDGSGTPQLALAAVAVVLEGRPAPIDWIDAARSVELAETIDLSLRKGRVVVLHLEDFSEEATFKGAMTSLGCGLIMACLAGLIVNSLPLGIDLFQYLPHFLLAMLSLFLAMQLLRFVFPQEDSQ